MPRWGRFFRNIWYLTGPYFRSEEKWSAIGLLLLVLGADVFAGADQRAGEPQ